MAMGASLSAKFPETDHRAVRESTNGQFAKVPSGCSIEHQITTESTSLKKKNSAKGFAQFWDIYPNKKGKAKAEAWWKKEKPDAPSLAEMLAAVAAQVGERKRCSAAGVWVAGWPMGSTWLKDRRWEDVVTVARKADPVQVAQDAREGQKGMYGDYLRGLTVRALQDKRRDPGALGHVVWLIDEVIKEKAYEETH